MHRRGRFKDFIASFREFSLFKDKISTTQFVLHRVSDIIAKS